MITIRIKRARAAKGEIERNSKTPRNGDTSALLITLLIILRTELTHTILPQTCGTLEETRPCGVLHTHDAMADRTAKGPSRDRVASAIALRLPLAPRTSQPSGTRLRHLQRRVALPAALGKGVFEEKHGRIRDRPKVRWEDVPSWQRSRPIDVSGLVINMQIQKGLQYFEAELSIGTVLLGKPL